MTVNRRPIVLVVIGLGLMLDGCSPTSPSNTRKQPKPAAIVRVTVSDVGKATIAPEKFSYTFRLHLTDSGGVSSTVTEVAVAFDGGWGYWAHISGDELGQNRRLMANGTLDWELTTFPNKDRNSGVENNAEVDVQLTDDNGNRVRAGASIYEF